MMTGDRDQIILIDDNEHRMPFTVRPAYHPDPNPGSATDRDSRITALWALAAIVIIVALVFGVHAIMPTIR